MKFVRIAIKINLVYLINVKNEIFQEYSFRNKCLFQSPNEFIFNESPHTLIWKECMLLMKHSEYLINHLQQAIKDMKSHLSIYMTIS